MRISRLAFRKARVCVAARVNSVRMRFGEMPSRNPASDSPAMKTSAKPGLVISRSRRADQGVTAPSAWSRPYRSRARMTSGSAVITSTAAAPLR